MPTLYTARSAPGGFTYQTWDQSIVPWGSLTFTWDTWGTGTPTTLYTARPII